MADWPLSYEASHGCGLIHSEKLEVLQRAKLYHYHENLFDNTSLYLEKCAWARIREYELANEYKLVAN